MRVRAYRNLNSKAVLWSIYSEEHRCVIAHCEELVLERTQFTVSESALHHMRHVLHKRWVVGWVTGTVLHIDGLRPAGRTERGAAAYHELVASLGEPDDATVALWHVLSRTTVRFDPWTMDQFQRQDGTSIDLARVTVLTNAGKCLARELQEWQAS